MHANSAREALLKMCTLPLLAGGNIPPAFVTPTVAGCVDLVVHLEVDPDGRRRVREIVGVPGRVEGGVIETGGAVRHPGRPAGPRRRRPATRPSASTRLGLDLRRAAAAA